MRLAPVAVRLWNDLPRLVEAATEQSRTTHGAEEAVDACRALAELLADAIAGSPRAAVLAPRPFEGVAAIARILAASWRGRARDTIRSSEYVVDTLEAAIWSVARTGDFRNTVLLAANLADDADTVAAVAGQLAGAIYGLDGIPHVGWNGLPGRTDSSRQRRVAEARKPASGVRARTVGGSDSQGRPAANSHALRRETRRTEPRPAREAGAGQARGEHYSGTGR